MKKTKLPKLFLMLALVVGLCVVQPRLNAQQDRQPAQQQQPDASNQAAQSSMTSQAGEQQTFSGKVAKAGGKFVLKDTESKATYVLDDQDKAKQFDGQDVKVSGSLDPQTKTIRVASISPGS
ncbi:MAG TPA: DUF5818 domain-containing protein [Terriglobales bacterium]